MWLPILALKWTWKRATFWITPTATTTTNVLSGPTTIQWCDPLLYDAPTTLKGCAVALTESSRTETTFRFWNLTKPWGLLHLPELRDGSRATDLSLVGNAVCLVGQRGLCACSGYLMMHPTRSSSTQSFCHVIEWCPGYCTYSVTSLDFISFFLSLFFFGKFSNAGQPLPYF